MDVSQDATAFEEALAELTARFVGLPADAVDAHIEATIGRVADLLDLDRAHVAQRDPRTGRIAVTQQWNRRPYTMVSFATEEELPWLMGRLARNERVVVRRLEDFPPDAVSERARMTSTGERSVLILPLMVGGQLMGALAFATLRQECDWSPHLVKRLRLVGEIVASALFRKMAERDLLRGLEFERLVSRLARDFVNLTSEAADAQIQSWLRAIAEFLELDLASVLQRSDTDVVWRRSHEWTRAGFPAFLGEQREDAYPWASKQVLENRQVLAVSRLGDLPPEAESERATLAGLGLRSFVLLPLLSGGQLEGILTLASMGHESNWTKDVLERLQICADVLANGLTRSQAERGLRAALEENVGLRRQLEAENLSLRAEVDEARDYGEIVGQSPVLRGALHKADQVANTDIPVLLAGETGTGKELVARAIHARSRRASRALIAVNCAALPATLVESELFGHEKGAFTGAVAAKPGRFELADGGTLLLDEIGELEPAIQAKLLRALQEGEVQRLGSPRPRKVDVRVVAATNRDLRQAMLDGRFRADLYYRLSVFPIELPPLRARREDIPLLVWYFVQARGRTLGRTVERISRAAMEALCAYDWPGNVRELQNVVERALILSRGPTLQVEEALGVAHTSSSERGNGSPESMDEAQRTHLLRILEQCRWTIEGPGQAAERLGLKPSTLRNRMRKLGLARPPS